MTDAPAPPVADQDDDEQLPEEGLDLRANGTIHLWIDGRKFRIRRPRLREFRRIREDYQERLDRIAEESARHDVWEKDLIDRVGERRKSDPAAGMTADERAEDQKRGRELTETIEREMLGWWVEVLDVLGHDANPRLDDDDPTGDLTPWLGNSTVANRAIGHWRSAPSLSGVR